MNAIFLLFPLHYNLVQYNPNLYQRVTLDQWNHAREFKTDFERNLKKITCGGINDIEPKINFATRIEGN
jgi:hypothetical protein